MREKFLGGSGCTLLREILKSRLSEMVFPAFTLISRRQEQGDILLQVTLHVKTCNSVLARKGMAGDL